MNAIYQCLRELSPVNNYTIPNEDDFKKVYVLYEFESYIGYEVIGTASLHVLQKLTHDYQKVVRIEDVAILKKYQGTGAGKFLVEEVMKYAKLMHPYKISLECKPELVSFYEKCGFKVSGVAMRYDV